MPESFMGIKRIKERVKNLGKGIFILCGIVLYAFVTIIVLIAAASAALLVLFRDWLDGFFARGGRKRL